ncbi:MAG: Cna B-type domain-containing protein, partial [Clostridia bacterium]|nr:Cna B-type domain-containing protein [Clostridia bacterium]
EETDDNGDPILNDTDSATVSLNKGNIYPGEEKEFLGSFPNGEKNKDDEGNAVITAGSANIGANLVWKITINNGDGDFSTNMVDYKVVDTLPDPYIFDDNYENDTYAGAKYNPSIIVFDENGNIKKSLKGLDFIKPEITDTRVLTWNFNGEEWQLKPNEKLEIIFPSRVENAGEIGAFLNTAKLVTTQVFTRDDVTTGDFVDEKTIESSDFANIYAFMTSSHKEIEYNPTLAGDVDYKQPDYDVGVSEKVDGVLKNTIEGQPNEKVKYTLNVKNESQVRIKDLVIIDRMPYEGDIGVIADYSRNSAFEVKWDSFICANIYDSTGNLDRRIDKSKIRITFSDEKERTFTYDAGDWKGQNDVATWMENVSEGAVNVRFEIIYDENDDTTYLRAGETLKIEFYGIIPEVVSNAGENNIAWNNFAYGYMPIDSEGVELSLYNIAEPAKVGVWVKEQTTTISGTKTWSDHNNKENTRPQTVTINLLANGEKVKETVISADNEWKYTFENIPIRDKNGDIIEYSVTEVPIANYESQVYGFNIVNTYSAVTSLSGEKIWNDKNNADNTRPDSIRVNLMANDVFVKSTIVTPDENNQWKYEFTGLPKYDENDELIFYTVTEDIVYVKGGSDVYTGYVDGNNIINTYIPKTEVSGTKTWNDYNNLDNTRPKSIVINLMKNGEVIDSKVVTEQDNWSYKFKDLDKYDENNNLINYTITEDPINNYEVSVSGYNITNTYTAKTNVVGTKIWDDYDNKENTRPDSIIVSLIANNEKIDERVVTAENNWNFSFLDLPKYDKDYNEINYSIIENQVKTKDGTGTYTSTITNGETDNSFVITNTYEVKKSYTIKKVWNDNDNQDGKRPTSIRVQLLANGIPQGDEITLSAGDDGIWQAQELTYTWTDLEKYDNSNNLIIYTVRENTIIEGYNASYDITSESNTTIVKNGHTPEVTSYSVQKIWEDNNNQDGKRPTKVKLQLKADGNPVGNIVVLSAGDDNVWQANELEYTWTNLPKFNNGELIKYTVEEQSVENGYATTYAEENGRTIVTNTRAPEKTAYYVEKVWNDNENQDGKRPTSVQIQLKANGNPVGNIVTLSAGEDGVWQADELKYTWTNLPKYENGQLIVYEVQESAVENGYEPAYNTETEGKTIITNSYTPEKTRYIVEKVWNDNDNQDGKRPTSVQIQLKVNGNSVGNVVTLSAGEDGIWQANELEYTWTDLPKYENGLLITYEVEESVVENGYEAAYNTQIEGKTIITNSYTPEKTRYTVEKIWNDSENQDGKRPESIQVQLQVDGEEFVYDGIVATQVLDESNSWTYTWENLPERLSGQIVEYKAVEIFIDNYYETSYDYITKNKTTVISNKHIPETTEHSVKKVWNDMDNQDGKRPTSIRVQLKADGNDYGEVITLTAGDDNIWQADELRYTWTNLPKYNNGREVKYVVEEQTPGNNYVITYATEPNKTTITNTRTPENITYEVQKVWDDADNQDGKRPTSIKVQLKADENDYGEAVTLTAGDDNIWQADELRYTWSNLPKYSNGIEIKYKVEEQDVGNGYVATYVEEDKKTIVTNTRLPEKTTYNVEKVWRDENNQDGIRSNSIEVQLIANKKVNGQIIRANIGEAVNLSEGNNWNYQWTNLEKNSEGTLIEYSVAEITTIDGYNTDYKNENDKTTITNIHVPEETSYSIEKVWDDLDNQDGKRPTSIKIQLKADGHNYGDIVTLTAGIDGIWQTNELTYTWSKLPKYNKGIEVKYSAEEVAIGNGYTEKYKTSKGKTTITNSYTPGKVNYSVEKVWIDSNNQDAKRPTEIEVELKANGAALVYGDIVTRQILNSSNGWSYTWEELPERLNGIVVNYTVVELSKIDEYPTAQYEYEDSKTIITNERETDKTKYSVKKLWDDNKNQDGIRPSSINVQLKADGEICGSEITLSDANNWSYTWNNLEKNKAGKEIVYTVTEVQKINGYETSKVDNNGETIITNRHTPETTKYSIRKVWKDANDQDGERPTSIKIQLMANGNTYGDVITLTAGEDGKWQDNELQYTWNELPKYKDGNIIKYSANELEVKDGYSVTYNTDKPDETTITNSYTPGEVTYSVEKVWEDSNNQDGIRPSNIEVKLIAKVEENIITLNGVDTTQTLNEENSWKFTWEKLPLKSAGKYIEYSVIENTQIADYEKPKYSYANGKTTIINKHEIKKVSKSVVKVWEDNYNQDGIRPESIKVQLRADGNVLGTPITLNQTNNWKYTWDNLDENKDGKTIQYTIEEIGIVDGYESALETEGNITKITNTHTPEQTEHSIEKVWNDSNNKDNVRPTQIKVQLKANGTNVGDVITLSAGSDNEWQDDELQYTWKNLPKYSNGIEIQYMVEEQDVDKKYVSSVTNITNKTIITNTHIIDTIDIIGKKIWVDENNKYSKRPESVVINLVRNGQVIKTFELGQDSNWEYKFVKLPKYDDNGNEYIYTISELPVDGYSSEVSGFNITNTYIPPVEVEKPEMIIGVKTGDNIALSINAIRLAIAVLIITFIIYKNERRNTQK